MPSTKRSTKKNKNICVICGKEAPATKLPHGEIHLCPNKCFKIFCAMTQASVPMIWMGLDDYTDRELFEPEELESQYEALVDGADAATDYLWNDSFGADFDDAVKAGAIEVERSIIRNAKREDLPLLLNRLKFPKENEGYLSRNIKERV